MSDGLSMGLGLGGSADWPSPPPRPPLDPVVFWTATPLNWTDAQLILNPEP